MFPCYDILDISVVFLDTKNILISYQSILRKRLAKTAMPKRFNVLTQVLRVMDKRAQLMEARQADWAMGECLAFLSLLKEGHHVRLSGEDVERGTFSHRIHIIHDQNKDKTFKNILHDVFPGQALYTVSNSSLSEYGVCGESCKQAISSKKAVTIRN